MKPVAFWVGIAALAVVWTSIVLPPAARAGVLEWPMAFIQSTALAIGVTVLVCRMADAFNQPRFLIPLNLVFMIGSLLWHGATPWKEGFLVGVPVAAGWLLAVAFGLFYARSERWH